MFLGFLNRFDHRTVVEISSDIDFADRIRDVFGHESLLVQMPREHVGVRDWLAVG